MAVVAAASGCAAPHPVEVPRAPAGGLSVVVENTMSGAEPARVFVALDAAPVYLRNGGAPRRFQVFWGQAAPGPHRLDASFTWRDDGRTITAETSFTVTIDTQNPQGASVVIVPSGDAGTPDSIAIDLVRATAREPGKLTLTVR